MNNRSTNFTEFLNDAKLRHEVSIEKIETAKACLKDNPGLLDVLELLSSYRGGM